MGDVPSLGRAMSLLRLWLFRLRRRTTRRELPIARSSNTDTLRKNTCCCRLHETRVLSAHPGLLQGSARHGGSRDQPLRSAQHIVGAAVVAIFRSIKIAASAELGLDADYREQHEIVTRDFAAGDIAAQSLQIKYAGRIHALLASSNLGAPLDACLAEFDQKRFPLLKTVVQAIVVYVFRAYARLAQYSNWSQRSLRYAGATQTSHSRCADWCDAPSLPGALSRAARRSVGLRR